MPDIFHFNISPDISTFITFRTRARFLLGIRKSVTTIKRKYNEDKKNNSRFDNTLRT
jgi:hypothetical protein